MTDPLSADREALLREAEEWIEPLPIEVENNYVVDLIRRLVAALRESERREGGWVVPRKENECRHD